MKTKKWAIALFSATIAVALSISTALAEVAEVTVNQLKLRSGPGLNYKVIFAFNKGARVSKIKQQGNWAYIAFGRYEGWVYAPYIRIVVPVPVPVPVTGEGSGGGNIGTGPAPSRYQSSGGASGGNINNARYSGYGSANAQIVEPNRVVVNVVSENRAQPFSVTYYGDVIRRSKGQIVANVTAFASTLTGNRTTPKNGSCQIVVSPDSNVLRSLDCQANSGLDHGKTTFTGR